MEGIGVILIIIFAIASSLNRRALKNREAAKKQAPAQGQRREVSSPFQQAMRQFQEAVEKAAGIEPAKKPEPAKAKQWDEKADKQWESEQAAEPDFRGSISMDFQPFEQRPELVRPVVRKPATQTKPKGTAAGPSGGILPRMAPNSLVQAVVTHEILTRPRTAWQPRREATRKAR